MIRHGSSIEELRRLLDAIRTLQPHAPIKVLALSGRWVDSEGAPNQLAEVVAYGSMDHNEEVHVKGGGVLTPHPRWPGLPLFLVEATIAETLP